MGFPAVIKPVNGAASLGVVRVNDTEELREAYRRVKKEMSMFKITSGALEASESDLYVLYLFFFVALRFLFLQLFCLLCVLLSCVSKGFAA